MIERALNLGPVAQDSYYFQLIPLSLSIVNQQSQLPAQGTTYKFMVSKGQQKFDQNKIPIEANFQIVNKKPVLVINSVRLNFYLPQYNKLRKQDFSFVMVQREHEQDYELGQYKVNIDDLITQFKESNKGRHQFKTSFSQDYELQFQIYIQKNRMTLERNIRQNKTQRINKSPLRARKEERAESPKRSFSPRQEQSTPSRDKEELTPQHQQKFEEASEVTQEKQQTIQKPSSPPLIQQPREQTVASFPAENKIEKSEKNESISRKSNQNVPIIETKFKQLSKSDTPSEIKIADSQRLGATIEEAPITKPVENSEWRQTALLWIFLIVSGLITYLSMHPNKKV